MNPSEEPQQVIGADRSLAEDRPERALRDFLVIRNHKTPVGRCFSAKHHMAALLAVQDIAESFERSNKFTPRYDRQPSHGLDLDYLFGD